MKSLNKQFLNFAIPSIVAMWVFSIYTMVDGFFVSRYVGHFALAAVNLSIPFVNTLFAISIIFGVGTSTMVGILLGKGKAKSASETFTFTTVILLISSVIILLLAYFNLNRLIYLLGARGNIQDEVMSYLGIIIFFSPFFMISYHFEVLVKIDGFPKLATWGVASSALSNIVLDYLLVGVFDFGVSGAAIATGIAQVISTLVFLIHFLRREGRIVFMPFHFNLSILRRIIPLGIGDFLAEFSTGFIVFLYNQFLIRTLGQSSVVTYTILSYVNLLSAMTMAGLTQGMQPLMSLNYGKRDIRTCKELFKKSIISIIGLSFIAILLSNIFGKYIVALFIKDNPQLLEYTVGALRKFSSAFIFLGLNLVLIGFFSSIGRFRASIILSLGRGFIFIYLALLFTTGVMPAEYIWFSSLISEALGIMLGLLLLKLVLKEERIKLSKIKSIK